MVEPAQTNLSSDDAAAQVVAVVGPTAVGKSDLAERLAERLGGEIVSADSMQVYRGMDVGTAKPPVQSRRVPYHCLDLVEPGAPYSAALYQRDARAAINDIRSRSRLPVLVGGTGLYLRAALDELVFPAGEQADNPRRDAYERIAAERGAEALHRMLAERDEPSALLLHPNNVRRVVRALEMLDEGTSYAEQAAGFSQRAEHFRTRWIGLTMARERLYERIDARVDAMIEAGLLDEVRSLLDRGLREALTAAQAIGYKELVPVVEGTVSLDEAVAAVKQATRRYAKRQLTWFRADPRIMWIDVTELSADDEFDEALRLVESGLAGKAETKTCLARQTDKEG